MSQLSHLSTLVISMIMQIVSMKTISKNFSLMATIFLTHFLLVALKLESYIKKVLITDMSTFNMNMLFNLIK